MCLYNASDVKNPPRFEIGYKVFLFLNNKYVGPYYIMGQGYSTGKIYRSRKGPGFHYFTTEKDAEEYAFSFRKYFYSVVVRKCRFSGPRTEGWDVHLKARTAERMLILD